MEQGREVQGVGEAERVREILGQRARLSALCERLIWVAKEPQDMSRIDEAEHSRLGPYIEERVSAELPRAVEILRPLQVHSS